MGLTHCYKTTVFFTFITLKVSACDEYSKWHSSLLITEEDETEKLSDVCSV